MATKARSIKERRETISARKKRGRSFNPLQRELDKPLAKSFKEGAAVAAVVAGPGKFGKGVSKITKKIKALRARSKASVKKNVGERTALRKKLEAKTKANLLRIKERDKIKALRARSKASVAKNVAERKALRKATSAKKPLTHSQKEAKLLREARAKKKAGKQLDVEEAGSIARKKAGVTRPEQGGSTQLTAGNRFPFGTQKAPPRSTRRLTQLEKSKVKGSIEPAKKRSIKQIARRENKGQSITRNELRRLNRHTDKAIDKQIRRANAAETNPRRLARIEKARIAEAQAKTQARNLKVNKAERQSRIKAEKLGQRAERRQIKKENKAERLAKIKKEASKPSTRKAAAKLKKRDAELTRSSRKFTNRGKIGAKIQPVKIPRITDKLLREVGLDPRKLKGGGVSTTGRTVKGRRGKQRGPKFE